MAPRYLPSIRVLGLALAALTSPCPAPAQDQGALARFPPRRPLDTGLDMIVVENHAVPLATVLVAVRNGAFTQDSAEQGLAHLYEHLLFRSYRGSPDAFGVEVTRLNGGYNGATDHEVVYYYVTVPSKNVERGVKIVARLVEQAPFSNGDLKAERPVVPNELQRDESDPEQQFTRQVDRMRWGAPWSPKDEGVPS